MHINTSMTSITTLIATILLLTIHPSNARLTGRPVKGSNTRFLQTVCDDDKIVCANGSKVGRNPNSQCNFYPCPPNIVTSPGNPLINVAPLPPTEEFYQCPQDPRTCSDGSFVKPDPDKDCEYPACPVCCDNRQVKEMCIFGEPECCEDGTWTCLKGGKYLCGGVETTNPSGTVCGEKEVVSCFDKRKECPDGTIMEADPDNDCEFFPCPAVDVSQPSCFLETKECPDGSIVGPDPDNDCEFFPCPDVDNKCCDLSKQPKCGDDFAACCENGNWSPCPQFDDGIAIYKCGDSIDANPAGVVCESKEQGCQEDAKICGDGTAVSRNPNNNCEFFPCPPINVLCCDPESSHSCQVGARKCCNGKWICPFNPDGNFYMCRGELTPNPSGIICEILELIPDQEPLPETTPRSIPETTQESPPERTQELLRDTTPGSIPKTTQESIPERTQELLPETTPGSIPETTPGSPTEAAQESPSKAGTELPPESTPGSTTEVKPIVCWRDQKRCPDGSIVKRDPNNDCEFFPCRAKTNNAPDNKPKGCTKELRPCRYGPSVGRDPNNNCEFFPCKAKSTNKKTNEERVSEKARRRRKREGRNRKGRIRGRANHNGPWGRKKVVVKAAGKKVKRKATKMSRSKGSRQ